MKKCKYIRLLPIAGLLLLLGCEPPEISLSVDKVELKEGSVQFELVNQSNHSLFEINCEISVTSPDPHAEVASMVRVVAIPEGLKRKDRETISVRLDDPDLDSLLENGATVEVAIPKGVCSFTNVGIQSFRSKASGNVIVRDRKVER